ncbi:hypothetical protein FN846DRAFT_985440 [Sphaerosporella brunnea]|uniref:Uncharacterized protein n=1 Tax=Sphaerosporella brunnea TaxID=1250544 RepID=A0A5J5EU62_9PEZI|nr:hypothetical protein FN846DRAFT_985440 [Sphaerosporella brunnea]
MKFTKTSLVDKHHEQVIRGLLSADKQTRDELWITHRAQIRVVIKDCFSSPAKSRMDWGRFNKAWKDHYRALFDSMAVGCAFLNCTAATELSEELVIGGRRRQVKGKLRFARYRDDCSAQLFEFTLLLSPQFSDTLAECVRMLQDGGTKKAEAWPKALGQQTIKSSTCKCDGDGDEAIESEIVGMGQQLTGNGSIMERLQRVYDWRWAEDKCKRCRADIHHQFKGVQEVKDLCILLSPDAAGPHPIESLLDDIHILRQGRNGDNREIDEMLDALNKAVTER